MLARSPPPCEPDICARQQNEKASNGATPAGAKCDGLRSAGRARQAGQLHTGLSAYVAFFATVLTCIAAAATVINQDIPLMLGGF